MKLQKGDIVLVDFPYTDLSQTKRRPAVILWTNAVGSEVTVCFVSSQKLDRLLPEEFIIDPVDPEFEMTGLKVASKVRVTTVSTLEQDLVLRRLGKLSVAQILNLNKLMQQAFQLL